MIELEIVKIEKNTLFMSLPTVKKDYSRLVRKVTNIDYLSYQKSLSDFGVKRIPIRQSEYCFSDNPREFVQELYKEQADTSQKIDYIITTYHSYPLLEESSTAIYNKKLLKNKTALAFSICDSDALAPIHAIDWIKSTKSNGIVICLEQVYDKWRTTKSHEFAIQDAAALFQISHSKQSFEIRGYSTKINIFQPQSLLENSINSFLSKFSLTPEEIICIPQCKNFQFLYQMNKLFPHIYYKKTATNLYTADVFYSLNEMKSNYKEELKHLLLLVISNSGNLGLILIKRT